MSFYAAFEDRVRRHIRELEAGGLRRSLQPPSGIDLSSNDYLSLSTHPLLKSRMAEAVMKEGCGAAASRLLRGDRPCFVEVERRFAAFKQAGAALYFGSGYAANTGVLATFIERHDVVFTDAENHASIVDGTRLSRAKRVKFPHLGVDRLAKLLRESTVCAADGPANAQKFLVTESLFSMSGDFAPLDRYAELCRETNTVLIVDEAHAVGVYGNRGSGCVEETGTNDGVFLTVNTAGKAMGVAGAFVAGPQWAIDFLIQKARPFIFSTAPPPPLAAALDASLTVIEEEPQRRLLLARQSAMLRALLREAGLDVGQSASQIIPVVLGENERASQAAADLQREGFDVRAIRPPAVAEGTARLRISVNIGLDEPILRRFAAAIERICSAVCS